ncbi:PQQ-binding-like beta-propeller repeat protein [Candidatus Poribacteria bacterium]|nr:PQQ-binding-like beta-propeller repeat protein [Candidatus Poribacteria bacterium]
MKTYRIIILISVFTLIFTGLVQADDWPEWRGPRRDAICKETGLLKEWPEGGPELLMTIEDLGKGFSSPSISKGVIYITSMYDNEEYISAFELDGTPKWKTKYGKAYTKSFPDARSTPTVDGDYVYVISGTGEVVCLDTDGEIKWSVPGYEKFEGKYGAWGVAESPLIVDNKVIYTPCGDKTTVVAMDKMTGETVWMSETLNDQSGYVSPLLVEIGDLKLIVTVTGTYIIGVNADNGNIEWKIVYKDIPEEGKGGDINIPTPVYHDGGIFVTSGYNHTGVMLELSDDGKSAKPVWVNPDLDTHHGGVVLVDGYIYGSNWINNGNGNWLCLDWESGKTMYDTKWHNKGSILAAEGMLYCYEEAKGNLGLVKATPDEFALVSSFRIEKGSAQHWGHPVISDGKLYIRHGDVMMVFDVKAK